MTGGAVLYESSKTGLRYQPALDGLRAFAVLAVIAFHDDVSWARGGFLGVDAFFVLSGFLITSLLLVEWGHGRGIGLARFWVRRARRLLPALLLVLVGVAAYAAVALPSYQLDQVRGDGLASLFYVANWRFIATGQSYFAQFASPSPLRHLWSLAIEEQFYVVWPLVVLACLRLARGSLRVLVAVCVIGIVVSTGLMAYLYSSNDPSRAYYGTDARAHTILVGALLAIALRHGSLAGVAARRWLTAAGLAGAIAVVWACHATTDTGSRYYRGGSLVFAIAVAAVIASVVQPDRSPLRAVLSLAPAVWIGRISYGLYLWHWPVDVMLTPQRVGVSGTGLDVVRLALTFGLAALSFYLVERPIRLGALRGAWARVAAPAAVACTGVAVLASTAGATAPPQYFGRTGAAAERCRGASSSDARKARSLLASRPGRAEQPAPSVLLVGDSLACSLVAGLEPALAGRARFAQASVVGCGVVTPHPAANGVVVPGSEACVQMVPRVEGAALRTSRPDLVVWYSSWERNDVIDRGHLVVFGSPEGDRLLRARLEQGLARLDADGARVMILAPAPRASGSAPVATGPRDTARFVHLRDQLVAFGRAHADRVTVVDLGALLCPQGPPCPAVVGGVRARPLDGAHFGVEGAVLTAQWITPRLLAALGRP